MLNGFELVLLALTAALLLYSGAWTDRKYRRFDQIPAHYDFRGNATRLTARRPMAWFVPILFAGLLGGLAAMLTFIPPEYTHGNPKSAFWTFIVLLPAAQLLILWLLARWAAKQDA